MSTPTMTEWVVEVQGSRDFWERWYVGPNEQMATQTLEWCVNLIKRHNWQGTFLFRYPERYRIRNVLTEEIIPLEALGLEEAPHDPWDDKRDPSK